MAGLVHCLVTAQSFCAMPSFALQKMNRLQHTCCCLAYSCCSIQPSAQVQFLSLGRHLLSHQSSRQGMPQILPTIVQSLWVSRSADCMLAFWLSAWLTSLRSMGSGLPLRQATGQNTALFIRPLCFSTSLTNTGTAGLRCICALWILSILMTMCSGRCNACTADC